MAKIKYASLQSQLGDAPCEAEDTEEMFWLRESDDYQSSVRLGNLLAGQYRFREAAAAYQKALLIRQDDNMLYLRLGGAQLTMFWFEEAGKNYELALAHGAPERSVAYPMGIWHYLRGEYPAAAAAFSKCLPCGGEQAIAAIYWHTLSSYRAGSQPTLLGKYDPGMEVGHHRAYKTAVSVFFGETDWKAAQAGDNTLDAAVLFYGLSIYLSHSGEENGSKRCMDKTLKQTSVWPCIPYLAAWNDTKGAGTVPGH